MAALASYDDDDVRAVPSRAEFWCAALCLVQCSEPLIGAIYQAQGAANVPGWANALWLPVYAFLAAMFWRDRRVAGSALAAAPVLTLLTILPAASALWSIDAGASLRRGVSLALAMGLGFYLAWRWTWAELAEVFAAAWALLAAGSFATALLAPDVGVMTGEHAGAWMGVWTHKNTLGQVMALGVTACLAAAMLNPRRRFRWGACALAAFALVLLSTSKTSLLAACMGVGALMFAAVWRRGLIAAALAAFAAFAACVLAAVAFLWAPDAVFGAFGREATLTGRTDIWRALEPALTARPWLGYGYAAFWLADDGPAFWVREAVRWEVTSAHHGWLEIALGLGRVGLALMAVQFALTSWRGLGAIGSRANGAWPFAFLCAFALIALSESILIQTESLIWVGYVALSAKLALDVRARDDAP